MKGASCCLPGRLVRQVSHPQAVRSSLQPPRPCRACSTQEDCPAPSYVAVAGTELQSRACRGQGQHLPYESCTTWSLPASPLHAHVQDPKTTLLAPVPLLMAGPQCPVIPHVRI